MRRIASFMGVRGMGDGISGLSRHSKREAAFCAAGFEKVDAYGL